MMTPTNATPPAHQTPGVGGVRRPSAEDIAAEVRGRALDQLWPRDYLLQVLADRLPAVGLLALHRHAAGWTVPQAVAELARTAGEAGYQRPPTVMPWVWEGWEAGQTWPSRGALDLLCRLFATRPDRLGFGRDWTPPEELGLPAAPPSLGGP